MIRWRAIFFVSAIFGTVWLNAGEPAGETIDLTKPKPPTTQPVSPEIQALVEQLGAPDTVQREDAEKKLLSIGAPATPALAQATKSLNPEIATRARKLVARMADTAARPASYASVLPPSTIFFAELRDSTATLPRLLATPLGKFINTAPLKTFLVGYRKEMIDTELKAFDSGLGILAQVNGKAMVALGDPSLIELQEIDPPLLMVLETAAQPLTEALVRNFFEGQGDPLKGQRQHGKYVVEEQVNSGTVFGQDRVIHGLTAKSLDAFLDYLQKPPQPSLEPAMQEIRAQKPDADIFMRLTFDGFPQLAEALQFVEDDQVKWLQAFGFGPGGVLDDALTFNDQGVHELMRLKVSAAKVPGLLNVISNLKPAPAHVANQPSALDLVPYQAAMVFGFNGDVDKHAAELTAALRALDALGGDPIHEDKPPAPAAEQDAPQPKRDLPGLSRSQEAIKDLLDPKKDEGIEPKKPTDGMAPKTPNTLNAKGKGKAAEPELERTTPHFDDLKKMGISVQQLLELADGPMYISLFPERIDVRQVTDPNAAPNEPDALPIQTVFAMFVKDSAPIQKSLENCFVGLEPRYRKQLLNGGTHYIDTKGDPDDNPGYWIDGNYVAYGTSKDVLEFATAGVQAPQKRMSARPIFQNYLKTADPNALLTVFADCEQFFEMPYKIGQINYDKNDKNHWPDYSLASRFLRGLALTFKATAIPGGLQLEAQTPFSVWGTYQSVMMPLDEANLLPQ